MRHIKYIIAATNILLFCATNHHTAKAQYFSQQTESQPPPPLTQAYNNPLEDSFDFVFSVAGFNPRAIPFNWQTISINTIQLNSLSTGYIPYNAIGAVYSVASLHRETTSFGLRFAEPTATNGSSRVVEISPHTLNPQTGRITTAVSSRTYSYRLSGEYGQNTTEQNGWAWKTNLSRRWGRSMMVEGVWTDAWDIALSASKVLGKGLLNITAIYNPTQRAKQRASTKEAYQLTNNNLYNPAWGTINGNQTSVNTTNIQEPIIIAHYTIELNKNITLNSALGIRTGENYTTALMWQNAANPYPDYYAYMPSYQYSDSDTQELTELWRDKNSGIQQIDFQSIYSQNLQNKRANYIVEQRVVRPLQLMLTNQMTTKNLDFRLHTALQRDHYFKRLESLLGGSYWLDIDAFVEQEEDIKDLAQNNLQNPNREIVPGDVFGYNYSINNFQMRGDATYKYSFKQLELMTAASIGVLTTQRNGHYEKENFSGELSLGESELTTGCDALLKLQAGYRLGTRLQTSVAVMVGSTAPRTQQIFLNQQYRNATNPHTQNTMLYAVELNAHYRGYRLEAGGALYHYSHHGDTQIRSLYDDLLFTYSQYVLSGINTSNTGLEGYIAYSITDNWKLSTTFSVQSNTYTSNPTAHVYKDSNGELLVEGERILYQGKHTGGSPQQIGAITLGYQSYGWMVRASVVGFAGAYVELSPVRYSERALRRTDQTITAAEMMEQEEMGANYSVDLFGGYTKWFDNGTSVGVYLSVGNVTNNRDIVSYGYQSDRFFRSGWSVVPQPSKYYYSLPLNFSLSCTFRF